MKNLKVYVNLINFFISFPFYSLRLNIILKISLTGPLYFLAKSPGRYRS